MPRSIFRKLLSFRRKKKRPFSKGVSTDRAAKLSRDLESNLEMIRDALGKSMDVVIRELVMCRTRVALIYIDGIVDRTALRENVIRALMVDTHTVDPLPGPGSSLVASVKEKVLSACGVQESREFNTLLDGLLGANIIVLFDGEETGLALKLPGFETRAIAEPHTESVVRGPREGFVESLYTNISMLRRKIKSPDLRLEQVQVGKVTKTVVCVAYIKGIVNPKIVDEVKKRLVRIDIDGVLESGYIEQFIEDAPFSIFPTVGNTEKPDKLAAQLLEGRVAIFTDGTPFVLTVPYLFMESIQASEDYYSRYLSGSLFRMLRLLALIFTTQLPALYVAVSAFNPEALPTPLLLTMASAKEGVPLPALGEVLVLGAIFEVLREAGVRLPRPVGQAVSIVGALVVGEAAVAAGMVGAPAVIVGALTAISSFVVPSQSDAQLFLRLFFTLLAGFAGFFGLFMGFILVLTHLASLRSFGVPYLSPAAPLSTGDLKDTFIRAPWWTMVRRPRVIGWKNPRRAGAVSPPGTPGDEEKELAHRYDEEGGGSA
ncbi:MAG: spore germination protein [Bacillota bacterium]|nr:spore germination protein [Bacillota bacterium]